MADEPSQEDEKEILRYAQEEYEVLEHERDALDRWFAENKKHKKMLTQHDHWFKALLHLLTEAESLCQSITKRVMIKISTPTTELNLDQEVKDLEEINTTLESAFQKLEDMKRDQEIEAKLEVSKAWRAEQILKKAMHESKRTLMAYEAVKSK